MKYQSLISPSIPSEFNGKNKVKVQIWYLCWMFLFRPSPHVLNRFKIFLLTAFGAEVAPSVKIKPSAYVSYPWNLSVGENSYIGDAVYIDALSKIIIGKDVSVSNRVYITSGTHDHSKENFDLVLRPVEICDQSWLAINSTILPGAIVGKGAMVGACSLVNREIPEGQIWAGVPARFVKLRR